MQLTTNQDADILRSAVAELIAEGLVDDQNNMQALTTALEISPDQFSAENVKNIGYGLKTQGKVTWKSLVQINYDKAASAFSETDRNRIEQFISANGLVTTGDGGLINFALLANWLTQNKRTVSELSKALHTLVNSSYGGGLQWRARQQGWASENPRSEVTKIGIDQPEYDSEIPKGLTPANLERWKSMHRVQPGQKQSTTPAPTTDFARLAEDVLLNVNSNVIREQARAIKFRGNDEATYNERRKFIEKMKFQGWR